ncbi:MAG: hypothetical protein MI923_09145 [Phycisphaerales bacterium]|nr:hypothetical protein [Phycisphaerales bacterium]
MMKRVVFAIVMGFIAWTVIWLGAGAVLQSSMPDAFSAGRPIADVPALVITLALSLVCSLAAGFVASKIGATSAGKAVLTLSLILLAVGIGVQVSMWQLMPVWYHLAFLAFIVPMTTLGGRFGRGTSQDAKRPAMPMSKAA